MCARYELETSIRTINAKISLADVALDFSNLSLHMKGFLKTDLAPVIVADESGKVVAKKMYFSLCPSWSKEFPYQWSTYNARLDRPNPKKIDSVEYIYQVPTWRDSFANGKTCLVPMTAAIESCYFGTHAGNIVKFKTQNDDIFFCAGIYDTWLDQQTGEVRDSFALLTDNPYSFFYNSGHDRSVVVLDDSSNSEWLLQKMIAVDRFSYLRENRVNKDWQIEIERPLAKGWEKKAPSLTEIDAIKIFE